MKIKELKLKEGSVEPSIFIVAKIKYSKIIICYGWDKDGHIHRNCPYKQRNSVEKRYQLKTRNSIPCKMNRNEENGSGFFTNIYAVKKAERNIWIIYLATN